MILCMLKFEKPCDCFHQGSINCLWVAYWRSRLEEVRTLKKNSPSDIARSPSNRLVVGQNICKVTGESHSKLVEHTRQTESQQMDLQAQV